MSYRRPRRLAAATIASLLLVPLPTSAGPEATDAAELLRLTLLADALFDEQPTWREDAGRLPGLPLLVEHIAAYIEDEGYGSGHVPASVTMDGDFGPSRWLEAGRYYPVTDRIELNERFLTDPSWADRPWLGVLVHEMLHAEGYSVEAQVQLITTEILARMANDGYPGALLELTDRLRRHALLSAWWLDAYEHDALPSSLAVSNTFPFCRMGCTQVSGDVEAVDNVRRSIFDAAELRAALARERFWLTRSQRDYDLVLGSYIVEPLSVLLSAACGEGHEFRLVRDDGWPPLFPSVDDTRAILQEIGWC